MPDNASVVMRMQAQLDAQARQIEYDDLRIERLTKLLLEMTRRLEMLEGHAESVSDLIIFQVSLQHPSLAPTESSPVSSPSIALLKGHTSGHNRTREHCDCG